MRVSRMVNTALIATLATAIHVARAEEVIDFESLPPELPGWSAVKLAGDRPSEYRTADKWDAPFSFALDADRPRAGSNSLKCEFSQEVAGISFGPPVLPASGTVEIRFFVRSAGLTDQEGALIVAAFDSDNKPLNGYREVAKIPASEDWVEVSWTNSLSPEAAGVRLIFAYKSLPADAKIWIDDISVKTVPN